MDFLVIPTATTNIFPLSNSKNGGQLVTEYNLRSRETVATPSILDYIVGPSYVHSERDLCPGVQTDPNTGLQVNSSVLQISQGRAVINGHYIETQAPILIDMIAANKERVKLSEPELKGKLSVGLRAFYSTEITMSGAMIPENSDGYYSGVQVVILPKEEFKTPFDANPPETIDKITAHLRLADFTYYNDRIANITLNPEATKAISAERIGGISGALEGIYANISNLDPNKLYVLSGSANDSGTNWSYANESLMVWDKNPVYSSISEGYPAEAEFQQHTAGESKVRLVIPHKQVEDNDTGYFLAPKELELPSADYIDNTPGVIDKTYTQNIKNIANKLTQIYNLPNGKQRYYLEIKDDEHTLPSINPQWNIGDYCVVGQDYSEEITFVGGEATYPSTMYVVVPGYVQSLKYPGSGYCNYTGIIPSGLLGANISILDMYQDTQDEPNNTTGKIVVEGDSVFPVDEPALNSSQLRGKIDEDYILVRYNYSDNGVKWTNIYDADQTTHFGYGDVSQGISVSSSIRKYSSGGDVRDTIEITFDSPHTNASVYINGSDQPAVIAGSNTQVLVYTDDLKSRYFQDIAIKATNSDSQEVVYQVKVRYTDKKIKYFFYPVATTTEREWSKYMLLSGEIPYAQTDMIGGFLNVDPGTALDAGYVYRDDNGQLRLVDYGLLRQGVLAYQLGEDVELPAGVATEEIQTYLDEYVNNRVAFPTPEQKDRVTSENKNPNFINVYVSLPEEEEPKEITISNIDSRFGASVYLHITGSANSNTTVNILDCEKIRIDNNLGENGPDCKIRVYRSSLYYDPVVFNYIRESNMNSDDGFSGMEDITLWHERYDYSTTENEYTIINGETVGFYKNPDNYERLEFWKIGNPDDNQYGLALRSITFSRRGDIVNCELLVADKTTYNNSTQNENEYWERVDADNVDLSVNITEFEFTLPNNEQLNYPERCLTAPINISGEFVSAYKLHNQNNWVIGDVKFAAETSVYGSEEKGSISFISKADVYQTDITHMPAWYTGKYHIFSGGVTDGYVHT